MIKGLKVLQLIDSLRPAGAEKMAVTYANALVGKVESSFLCATRIEGGLKFNIVPEVGYLFLNKRSTFDLKAILKFRNFVLTNKINLIHAHGTSFFLALMEKMTIPGVKLIWHDHLGERANKNAGVLGLASNFFDGIISVNRALANWAEMNLNVSKIIAIPNFLPDRANHFSFQPLEGGDSLKIVCVANVRKEKDHLNLLKAFTLLKGQTNATLHLIGKIPHDDNYLSLEKFIKDSILEESIFFYGQKENVEGMIAQADIGVLASYTEGLPVALLEYGRAGLAVVCTDVGECSKVIGEHGKIVPPKDPTALAEGILFYIKNVLRRVEDGQLFKKKVLREFSKNAVLPEVLEFYKRVV